MVLIREPAMGAEVAQPFTVRATVQDDSVVDQVTVEAGGETLRAMRGPYAWSLAGFPPGPLTLTVTATDSAGNRASTTAEVVVTGETATGCAVVHGARTGAPGWWVLFCATAACSRRRRRL
jgi:hypothetical protein